jgi:DnaJ-class molecular chaperone with C-terminal Zn finger domain
MGNFIDYYEILGLSTEAQETDIKQTYRKLAKKFHPDLNKSFGSEELFKEVQTAYETLGDAEKKKRV